MTSRVFIASCLMIVLGVDVSHGAEAPTVVEVRMVVAKDLPMLDEERVGRVLGRARKIVGEVCLLDVEFKIVQTLDADDFLAAERKRVEPFDIATRYSLPPVDLSVRELDRRIVATMAGYTRFAQLRGILGDEASSVEDEGGAAKILSARYVKEINKLLAAKRSDGKLLMDRSTWQRYSLAHWGIYLHSREWSDKQVLYLTNVLLFDDILSGSPEELALGPATNGVALPASRCAVVSYFNVLSNAPFGEKSRVQLASKEEEEAAAAYLIAQQVGLFLLKGDGPGYEEQSGLGRPLGILRHKRDITDMERLAIKERPKTTNSPGASYTFKVLLRMDMFIAQRKWEEVLKEAERGEDERFQGEMREQLELRVDLAGRHF